MRHLSCFEDDGSFTNLTQKIEWGFSAEKRSDELPRSDKDVITVLI